MRRLRTRKKPVAAVALLLGWVLLATLTAFGLLGWALAAQFAALGLIGTATAALVVWVRRIDQRTRDLHHLAEGRDPAKSLNRDKWLASRTAQARQRAWAAFREGRLQEAIEELLPYTELDEPTDRLRRRLLGDRRALGPLPPLPHRSPDAPPPVPGRILHLVTNAQPHTQAGYTVRTHRIVMAQRAVGLEPHVVTFPGWPLPEDDDTAATCDLDGITYHRIRPGTRFQHGLQERIDLAIWEVTELARRLRPAVLHAASDHRNATVALHVGRALGIPVVYELRGFLEETWLSQEGATSRRGSERHQLLVERESSVLRAADAVVTLAETMREEILRRGVAPERVALVPNAVDTSLLEQRPDGAAYRAALGIATREFVVGSVSSLTHYEGFETLLEAAALMREAGTELRVLLVGDGAERPALLARAKRLGLDDTCVFPGQVGPEEALRAQAALDVMVVPRVDTRVARLVTPLKPVEAMALGVPVVASDLPALRELLADGHAGTLVPPQDAIALADAITRLRKDDSLRDSQVRAARKEVVARRTWSRNAEVYRELYQRLGALSPSD